MTTNGRFAVSEVPEKVQAYMNLPISSLPSPPLLPLAGRCLCVLSQFLSSRNVTRLIGWLEFWRSPFILLLSSSSSSFLFPRKQKEQLNRT